MPYITDKLKSGYAANGRNFRVHPGGYDFLPYFKDEVDKSPRQEIYYFSQVSELNANSGSKLEDPSLSSPQNNKLFYYLLPRF